MKTSEDTNKFLTELYYNPKFGLQGLEKFWQTVRDKKGERSISKKDVTQFYKSQEVNQQFKKPDTNKQHKIRCPWLRVGCLQGDLMDIGKFKLRNGGYTFILNVIDIYSRYAWSIPIKGKTNQAVLVGMKKKGNLWTAS